MDSHTVARAIATDRAIATPGRAVTARAAAAGPIIRLNISSAPTTGTVIEVASAITTRKYTSVLRVDTPPASATSGSAEVSMSGRNARPIAAAAAIGLAFRPLMLTSALPEVADAGGVSTRRTEVYFLVVMALATSMTVPVVGALLMFSLMIGPAAAARAVTARPGVAMALSVAIALATVWLSIALSYRTNWPLGFFVGVAGAVFYLAAHVRGLSPAEPPGTVRRHRDMKRIAAVALLVLAAAGCGGAGGGAPPEPAPTAQAGFAGYEWSVVAIGHDGKRTPIPARYSVYLQFAPDGRFGANDPVNYHFGSYRRTGDGFTIGDIASSLVGYAGADPVTLLAIGAISAFGKGAHATATVAGDRLTVTAGGYTLTCRRDGAQADFPPPTPT